MRSPSTLSAAVGALLLAALGACQSPAPPPPPPTSVAHTKQLVATVETVDMSTRQVLLRTPNGARATVVAGPEVRNLPQLRAGDRVTVTYQEAIAVQMAPPGSTRPNAAALMAQRAAAGQLPGGAVRGIVTARVTVVSVAPDGTSVTFSDPRGVLHIAEVQDPNMQSFAQRLRPGDQVDVDYASELAVRVEPMQ
ncbi:MAG: hypothetical protein ACJ8AW_17335 [Rhodopila sp.]|jgi:hypothetical protein